MISSSSAALPAEASSTVSLFCSKETAEGVAAFASCCNSLCARCFSTWIPSSFVAASGVLGVSNCSFATERDVVRACRNEIRVRLLYHLFLPVTTDIFRCLTTAMNTWSGCFDFGTADAQSSFLCLFRCSSRRFFNKSRCVCVAHCSHADARSRARNEDIVVLLPCFSASGQL